MRVPFRIVLVAEDHGSVFIKPDIRTVVAPVGLGGTHDNCPHHFTPFLLLPPGVASFTEATMMSPTRAYLFRVPPGTLMHIMLLAPGVIGDPHSGHVLNHADFTLL